MTDNKTAEIHTPFDRSEWSIDELFETAANLSVDMAAARRTIRNNGGLPGVVARTTDHLNWLKAEAADVQAEITRRRPIRPLKVANAGVVVPFDF